VCSLLLLKSVSRRLTSFFGHRELNMLVLLKPASSTSTKKSSTQATSQHSNSKHDNMKRHFQQHRKCLLTTSKVPQAQAKPNPQHTQNQNHNPKTNRTAWLKLKKNFPALILTLSDLRFLSFTAACHQTSDTSHHHTTDFKAHKATELSPESTLKVDALKNERKPRRL